MIGSISKIRPCGHHHYYKYAHATEGRHPELAGGKKYDMYQVSRDYWNDVDENDCWNFSLENAIKLWDNCFELGRFTKFKARTPNLISGNQMFTGDNGRASPPITEIEMDYHNLTNVYCLFYGMQLNDLPANFNPKTTNLEHLMGGGCAAHITKVNGKFPFHEVINNATGIKHLCRVNGEMDERYTFENATDASAMAYANGFTKVPPRLSLKNATIFSSANYGNKNIQYFQTVDEMSKMSNAKSAFMNCTNFSSLYPDYESFSWPKLSDATQMFENCILDKQSIIKLSNALPNWTGDSKGHNITIGCHIDNKYVPEVNVALKKINHNYITPIEENGEALPETITSSKNWTLTVQWNGVENGSIDEIIDTTPLELDTIQLPDNYTRCEYLEDTGTQWIDTGYVPTNTTGIYGFAKQLTHSNGHFVGSGSDTSNTGFTAPRWLKSTGNTCGFGWLSWNSYGAIGDGRSFESYLNYKNDRIAKICHSGAITKTNNLGTLGFTPTKTIHLFKTNHDDEVAWTGRIYRVKISEGTEVVRDFIPCLNGDGVPCMRDIINGVDYINQGTDEDFAYKVSDVSINVES